MFAGNGFGLVPSLVSCELRRSLRDKPVDAGRYSDFVKGGLMTVKFLSAGVGYRPVFAVAASLHVPAS
jgi:hypothetical protein